MPQYGMAQIADSSRPPLVICQSGLFSLRARTPPITVPFVPNLSLVPHANTSIRHYAHIWRTQLEQLGRPLSPSDWSFFQAIVLPQLTELSVGQLARGIVSIPDILFRIGRAHGTAKAERAARLLRCMGRSIASNRLAPLNPCSCAAPPSVHVGLGMHPLTPSQRHSIVRRSMGNQDLAPVGLLMETGIALQEACRLVHADLDLANALLHVRAAPEEARFSRTIPLSRNACLILAYAIQGAAHPNERLFLNRQHAPYSPATLRTRIAAMQKVIGAKRLTHSDLVNDFILCAVRCRIDPVQLKDYLGFKHPGRIMTYWQSIPRLPAVAAATD